MKRLTPNLCRWCWDIPPYSLGFKCFKNITYFNVHMKTAASNKIPTRKASDIDEIIIHCSATPAGMNFNADDIDRWHKAQGYRPGAPRFPGLSTGGLFSLRCPAPPLPPPPRPRRGAPPAEPPRGANFRPVREIFAPRLGGIWKFVITLLSPSATAPVPHGPAPRHRHAQTPLIHSEKQ